MSLRPASVEGSYLQLKLHDDLGAVTIYSADPSGRAV